MKIELKEENWMKRLTRSSGRQKSRTEELLVIHETTESVNDDDAMELFKATLTSLSLVQDCQRTTGLPGHSETQIPTRS